MFYVHNNIIGSCDQNIIGSCEKMYCIMLLEKQHLILPCYERIKDCFHLRHLVRTHLVEVMLVENMW